MEREGGREAEGCRDADVIAAVLERFGHHRGREHGQDRTGREGLHERDGVEDAANAPQANAPPADAPSTELQPRVRSGDASVVVGPGSRRDATRMYELRMKTHAGK